MELEQFVRDFASGMERADAKRPQAYSHRDKARAYQPGIGPFSEDEAVKLTLAEMRMAAPGSMTLLGSAATRSGEDL
jgi:hypothetical protein